MTDPDSPEPLVSASHHLHGGYLLSARAVTTFTKGGRHHGVVGNETQVTAADQRDGVQVFEMVFLTADAGSDQMVEVGSAVTLDGSASAVTNGGTLSYSWTQVSGPNVALNEVSGSPEQATFTMTGTNTGTAEINHTVTSNDTNYTIPTIGTVTATTTGTDPGTDPGTADAVFVDVDNTSSHAASINAVFRRASPPVVAPTR